MSAPITRNLTILLTDIKGFTDKTSQKSRAEIQQMLDRHKEIVLPILQAKGGHLVKTIGDAFLMTFESPTDAVLAGVQVQEALREHNADKSHNDRIEIRIAINQGEVNISDNDVFGEPVNITARIEAIAEAGEVFFTDAVYLAMNKKEVPSSEVGLLQLKGIPEKVRVYKVRRENPVEAAGPAEPAAPAKRLWQAINPLAGPAASVAAPPAAGGAKKPRIRRRLGAVLIDAALCGIIISMLVPGDRAEVHIRKDSRWRKAAVAAGDSAPQGRAQNVHPKTAAGGKDASGVSIDDGGIHGRGISIDDNGVHLPGVSIDDKGVRLGGLVSKDEDADDDDGWKVRAHDSERRFPWFALCWFVYSLFFIKWLGTTPGGRICKLVVVPMTGSGPLEKRQRLMRAFFSLISGYCLLLGYLWALWEKDGRGWHDLMAGTRVVDAP